MESLHGGNRGTGRGSREAGINLLSEKKGLPTYFPIIPENQRSWDFLLPTYPGEAGTFNFSIIPENLGLPTSQIPIIPQDQGPPTSQLSHRSKDFLFPIYPGEAETSYSRLSLRTKTSYFAAFPEKQELPNSQLSQRSRNCIIPNYPRKEGTA